MPAIRARLRRLEARRLGRALTDLTDAELELSLAWINARLAYGGADPPCVLPPSLAERLARCLPEIEPTSEFAFMDDERLGAEARSSLARQLVDAKLAAGPDLADASIEALARLVVGPDVAEYLDRACAAVEAEQARGDAR